jgi:hypothetical protein
MRALSDAELLGLWERGFRRHPLDRALAVLAAALPEVSYASLADWPLGRRNQALAELRGLCFGSRLRGWTACTACGEKLEFELEEQILTGGTREAKDSLNERVSVCGRTFRLPTSRDLAKVAGEADATAGAVRLAECCLLEAKRPTEWSEDDVSAIGEQLAMADPFAETRLQLKCPDCGNEWAETLDLVSFFWTEIEARVKQVLFAIHTLATAYGWSEADILSLSENRRALYLEMAQS